MPALTDAWRAGFWPCAAVRIWPRMVSETSFGATSARASAAWIAVLPSSCAGTAANAPLNDPTAVRAPETMTTSVMKASLDDLVLRCVQNDANASLGKLGQIFV